MSDETVETTTEVEDFLTAEIEYRRDWLDTGLQIAATVILAAILIVLLAQP